MSTYIPTFTNIVIISNMYVKYHSFMRPTDIRLIDIR